MLFNTIHYAIFFPVVFALYWFVLRRRLRAQNLMLLSASYFFYACWDWRFVFLLAFSTLLDYFTGLRVHAARSAGAKRAWLVASVGINLGFLGVFKYFNFFAASFTDLARGLGYELSPVVIDVLLPVGISFYTFHGLSYVLDIYYGRKEPTTDLVNYSLFVAFFPLLVAGPIERATHLLPQLERPRTFNRSLAVDGCRQLLWGLFKKMVVADNAAQLLNPVFDNHEEFHASTLVYAAVLFAFQIYGDFSGYSDIALGSARLLGIELLQNFAFPYFSRDIAEFWRRWHISLSSWFRDYVYIPLGGNRGGKWMAVRNTAAIFLVSGFWHGANWTFLAWGALHAMLFMPLLLTGNNRRHLGVVAEGRWLPTLREAVSMLLTFGAVALAWVFFRAKSIGEAISFLSHMVDRSLFSAPERLSAGMVVVIALLLLVEWRGRTDRHALQSLGLNWPRWVRWAFYYVIVVFILRFAGNTQQFIYFQF
jgi:alginate O-acetyltransferase complex protein AlgI